MSSDDLKKAASEAVSHAQHSGTEAKGAASDYMAKAGDRASDMASQASGVASDVYARARDKIQDAADAMPNSASEAMAQGQKVYERGSAQVVHQVKKQPLEALLLAAAVGYLVGWATSR